MRTLKLIICADDLKQRLESFCTFEIPSNIQCVTRVGGRVCGFIDTESALRSPSILVEKFNSKFNIFCIICCFESAN